LIPNNKDRAESNSKGCWTPGVMQVTGRLGGLVTRETGSACKRNQPGAGFSYQKNYLRYEEPRWPATVGQTALGVVDMTAKGLLSGRAP